MKQTIYTLIILMIAGVLDCLADDPAPVTTTKRKSYAWELLEPLGVHEPSTIDTTLYNYGQRSIPTAQGPAYSSVGPVGSAGINMIYFDRKPMSDFFFRDALLAWLPMQGNHRFYNTPIPMTLLSYNTGNGREDRQDRLTAVFSGNANSRLQFGGNVDLIYAKGSYVNQACKNFTYGLSSSYMGDRYDYQAFFNHYNGINQNNGGITDDLYITDPAVLQGGQTTIEAKSIPTNLSTARTRMKGQEFYMNHRYKIGFWHETPPVDSIPDDTVPHRIYIPVTSVVWTFDYSDGYHKFINNSPTEAAEFWQNAYMTTGASATSTAYHSLRNTVGIQLLEGFNKYAKAGLSGYVTYELRRYRQAPDSIPMTIEEGRPENLTPYPYDTQVAPKVTENLLWVGAQLTKQRGSLLRYEATARIGLIGPAAGEVYAKGNILTSFRLRSDSIRISAYGLFANESAPYLMNNYVSNYFIWKNSFGKIRRFRVGGEIDIPQTRTHLNIGVENIQNAIYFNENCLPTQNGGSVQVLNASLIQNFRVGILNWNNRVTFQTSSNQAVIPLPRLSVYSNLFIDFKVAKVLRVNLGVDCDFYTRYTAPGFQPATLAFYNQREIKVGNYPLLNVYANMKLKRARFYVLFSHVNQGMTGSNYFTLPHYPITPRHFQMGVSVDFAN